MNVKVIGIGGYARCGKDTFVGISKNILTKNGYKPIKIAFADSLKEEAEKMLRESRFSATVYTEDSEVKTLIRPLLVWWGCQRRRESDGGLYWVNIADEKIHDFIDTAHNNLDEAGTDPDKLIFLISDVRFKNESTWIKETWKGEFIHLKRWSNKEVRDGYGDLGFAKVFDPAPNEEELIQDPIIQEMADQKVEWENKKKMTSAEAIGDPYLQSVVLETLNSIKFFKHPTTGILTL